MARWVLVWSLTRGVIDPAEALSKAQQVRAQLSLEAEAEEARVKVMLRRRATEQVQLERDPAWV